MAFPEPVIKRGEYFIQEIKDEKNYGYLNYRFVIDNGAGPLLARGNKWP